MQPLLYCRNMMYAVMSHHIRHLPGIWYDTFDVTSRAMTIGGKLPTDAFWPVATKPEASMGRNQGQWALTTRPPVLLVHKGQDILFHRYHFGKLRLSAFQPYHQYYICRYCQYRTRISNAFNAIYVDTVDTEHIHTFLPITFLCFCP